MAAKTNHKALFEKLKKQVKDLQRKEALAKSRLHAALKQIGKLGKSYKSRLATSMRKMKVRIAQIEKKHAERLLQSVAKKGKKTRKATATKRKK